MRVRQPIVAVLGHVDSGKTSLLDTIRGTGVQGREAGGITQHIGASFLPAQTLRESCGRLYDRLETSEFRVPGILVIDTPGHEVFRNLRTRGGSAADIAILVVDANRGFQMQTNESLDILRKRRVPFVVALNKVDALGGWRKTATGSITEALKEQGDSMRAALDEKIYAVVGSLSVLGYESEAFWRVGDFKRQVAIVPVSARTRVGIPELLTVLVGLTQQYLKDRLDQSSKEPRGIVLEVNDEPGLGETANVILVDGSLSMGDTVTVATRGGAISTRPRAILLPRPLDEMRDPRDRFMPVESVDAAAGVKIASPGLAGVLPGSTLYVDPNPAGVERHRAAIDSEIGSVFIDTATTGIIVKCDTIGSLEALTEMVSTGGTAISKADIGAVTKRDIAEARATKERNRHLGVILAFNVRVLPDAREEADAHHVRIFDNRVIYDLVDSYTRWVGEDSAHIEDAIFSEMTPVSRFTFMEGCAFRNSGPAVFGVRVEVGTLRQKVQFMDPTGRRVGTIHQLQRDKKPVDSARAGEEVACSVNGVTIGRQLIEGTSYYALPTSPEAKKLLAVFAHRLSSDEISTLNEIVAAQRSRDPAYAY
ncbi:MAG: translation initiation factor IF-2 [Thaumarchaeota archaeon]|nr:translation initiation factor IF-2 [Nitrososphaerota archaeon]RNJ71386.1 MAG: translation initiation factor IF-2 [Thaumarchaeota archaeon S13]